MSLDWDLPHLSVFCALWIVISWSSILNLPTLLTYIIVSWTAVCWLFFIALVHYTAISIRHRHAPWISKYSWNLLFLIRPVQALFRLITSPIRVTPDVVIIGEVRCGTTSTAKYINKFPGCHTPFCLWKVPFADDKESFYLVGHYLSLIHPFFYRMVFPTIFTKMYCRVLGKPFFTYDACAQYATAPWAAKTLHHVNSKMGILHCMREPVSQNVSWWNFELETVKSFRQLGLPDDFVVGRQPSETMADAWKVSSSDICEEAYTKSENLACNSFLPLWASTWPLGQSHALQRMGIYSRNAKRFLKHFKSEQVVFQDIKEVGTISSLSRINLIMPKGCQVSSQTIKSWASESKVHENSNSVKSDTSASPELLHEMREFYKNHNSELEKIVGRPLNY